MNPIGASTPGDLSQGNHPKSEHILNKKKIAAEAIQLWLVRRIATELKVDREKIDVRESFDHINLDSVAILAITLDLEQWLGFEISVDLVWDYPTIHDIANLIVQKSDDETLASIIEKSEKG